MTQLVVSLWLTTALLALVVREVLVDHGSVLRAVDRDGLQSPRGDPGASARRPR